MKNILITIAFSLIGLMSFATTNPYINNGLISSTPIDGSSPTVDLSLDFGNSGNEPIAATTDFDESDPIVLKISLASGTVNSTLITNPAGAVSGTAASYFTWTFNAATATFTGTQNQTIPALFNGKIIIKYQAIAQTPITKQNNGFSANLTSNGNAPNGVGTNDIADDYVALKTYVEGALPVTLIAFDVVKESNVSAISWRTTREINSSHFDIEHSINAKNWNKIGNVAANQESKSELKYSFTHNTPFNGTNYYRLKMVDLDETFTYSTVRSLVFDLELVAYPNPVIDRIFLKGLDASQFNEASIINTNGIEVASMKSYSNNGLDVNQLQNGIYLFRLKKVDGSISTHKIVIRK